MAHGRRKAVKASLIITTFNWEEALELCLVSAFRQSLLPAEILVADDGSRRETGDLVRHLGRGAPVPVHHIWQEDRGFRAAKIRNKAMARAAGEYLVIVDGDVLLHHRFLEDHLKAAREGFFAQGSRVLLTAAKTGRVLDTRQQRFSPLEWGLENRKNAVRSRILSRLVSGRCRGLKGIRTCNFAVWRRDAVEVNGFNEDFVGWGREDSEFAVRLMNRGVSRQNLRFGALVYHLFHPDRPRNALEENDRLLAEAVRMKSTRCRNGLDQYLDRFSSTP